MRASASGRPRRPTPLPYTVCPTRRLLAALIRDVPARYVLISYNSEGFILPEQMEEMLAPLGQVEKTAIDYNVYRASRNLSAREIHVNEYLFLLKKR